MSCESYGGGGRSSTVNPLVDARYGYIATEIHGYIAQRRPSNDRKSWGSSFSHADRPP